MCLAAASDSATDHECHGSTFGSSVYTPGLEDVAVYFNVTPTVALLGLTVFLVGIALGPIIAAPISETHGRLNIYRFGFLICMLFTLGAGFSRTFAQFLVCRFFAGAAGSPVIAVGAGTNTDLFRQKDRALAASAFIIAPFLGPSLG